MDFTYNHVSIKRVGFKPQSRACDIHMMPILPSLVCHMLRFYLRNKTGCTLLFSLELLP